MIKISESDYLYARGIIKEYEEEYYNKIRNGNHKQFKLDPEFGVICRCGEKAVKLRKNQLLLCKTITAYPCEYSK